MSKSLNNFTLLKDILKVYSGDVLRLLCFQHIIESQLIFQMKL